MNYNKPYTYCTYTPYIHNIHTNPGLQYRTNDHKFKETKLYKSFDKYRSGELDYVFSVLLYNNIKINT